MEWIKFPYPGLEPGPLVIIEMVYSESELRKQTTRDQGGFGSTDLVKWARYAAHFVKRSHKYWLPIMSPTMYK